MQFIIKEKYTFPEHFKSENYYAIFFNLSQTEKFPCLTDSLYTSDEPGMAMPHP